MLIRIYSLIWQRNDLNNEEVRPVYSDAWRSRQIQSGAEHQLCSATCRNLPSKYRGLFSFRRESEPSNWWRKIWTGQAGSIRVARASWWRWVDCWRAGRAPSTSTSSGAFRPRGCCPTFPANQQVVLTSSMTRWPSILFSTKSGPHNWVSNTDWKMPAAHVDSLYQSGYDDVSTNPQFGGRPRRRCVLSQRSGTTARHTSLRFCYIGYLSKFQRIAN